MVYRCSKRKDWENTAEIISAAENGEAVAQNWLGYHYWLGEHVPKDLVAATEWVRKAAEQGDREAQANLGGFYFEGIGVGEDRDEAAKWFLKAAIQGQDEAQLMVGFLLHELGEFVQAVDWYRRSADQGNATAQNNLGNQIVLGKGTRKNFVEAYKWACLAVAQGVEEARELLEYLEGKMTREAIAEGQRLAAEFVPKEESVGLAAQADPAPDTTVPSTYGDVTNLLERLELFEERLNLRLEALQARYFLSTDNVPWLKVCGEAHPRDGVELKKHLTIVVDVYDSAGRVINTGSAWLSEPEKFFGFETFNIVLNILDQPRKIRIYPKST
jgi:hypothetical protein